MWNCQQTLGSMKDSRSQVSTAKLKSGMEEQSTFHCSSESQWQPTSPLWRRLEVPDNGPQATQTHRSLLRHVCSRFFYQCTKVHVLRVAANCGKTKPVISPWNRFLLGLTGYLWINLLNKEVNELQRAGCRRLFSSWSESLWPQGGSVQLWYGTRGGLWLSWAKAEGLRLNCHLREGYGAPGWREEGVRYSVIWGMGEFNSPKGADFLQVWVQNMTKKKGSEGRLLMGSFQMEEESCPSSHFSPTLLKCKKGWHVERHFEMPFESIWQCFCIHQAC